MKQNLVGPGCVVKYTGPEQKDLPQAIPGTWWAVYTYPDQFNMIRCVNVIANEAGGAHANWLYTNAGYFEVPHS